MNRAIVAVLVLVLSLGGMVAFAQEREFKLKDGGVVRGELVSRENHIYQIKTKTLGVVSVKDSDVIDMESAPVGRTIVTPEMFKRQPAVTEETVMPIAATPIASTSVVDQEPGPVPAVAETASPVVPAQPTVSMPNNITQKIVGDPAVMESMANLASDPMLLEMMADPQIKAALASNDLEFLKNNEKFLNFMNNSAVKDLTKQFMEGTPQEKREQK